MKYELFLDLDGVCADFESKVKEITGFYPHEIPTGKMWKACATHPEFFATLDWKHDGQELWNFCKDHNPTILTGMPHGKWASGQKKRWVGEKMGWDVPVITCMSSDKPEEAMKVRKHPNSVLVLIDDREDAGIRWKRTNGVFIHHTSTSNSIHMFNSFLGTI